MIPPVGDKGQYVLILAPVEREKSTKTGTFDETVILDGDICKELGHLLAELSARMLELHQGAELTPLCDFNLRKFLESFKGAVARNRLPDIETVYQARHGGASRDVLRRARSQAEVKERLHHQSDSSFRLYNKPGRVQQLVRQISPELLRYAGLVRDNYAKFVLDGGFPDPLTRQLAADAF